MNIVLGMRDEWLVLLCYDGDHVIYSELDPDGHQFTTVMRQD